MILRDSEYLKKVMAKVEADPKAQLISLHQELLRPANFAGKVIYAVFKTWDYIRLSVPRQDHVQNLYSGATLFRGSFVADLRIPPEVLDERTYLYLMAKKQEGFRFSLTPVIYYWAISSFKEYFRLANRAFGTRQDKLEELFGERVNQVSIIPMKYKCIGMFKSFYYQPLYVIPSLVLGFVLSILTTFKPKRVTSLWEISSSTKMGAESRTSRKTIIISCYDDLKNPVYGGGGAACIFELAKQFSQKSRVILITGTYRGAKNEMIDGIECVRVGSDLFGHQIGQLIYQAALLPYVFRRNYDLWIESSTPPFTFSLLPLMVKKPLTIWIHMFCGNEMKRKYKLPFHWLERLLARNYPRAVVLSPYMEKLMIKMNPSCIVSVIPNGVRKDSISSHVKDVSAHLLFLGRIDMGQKGIDLMLKAYELIPDAQKPPLVIAGNGEPKELKKLMKLINNSSSSHRISYVGRASGAVKQGLLESASAVIVPSRFDTYPLTVLEAFSHGKPVIIFSIPQLSWVPITASLQIPPYEIKELSTAMNTLHHDVPLQRKLGREGLAFVSQNTLEGLLHRFEQLSQQHL
ncbi:glycosyltransferase family 4 protein [Candidatus Roizmanbacteria bacterium]|nr:glycosyltransferase family 4 protein [Candidatus Roizmanbacteria bacterium]